MHPSLLKVWSIFVKITMECMAQNNLYYIYGTQGSFELSWYENKKLDSRENLKGLKIYTHITEYK